MKSRIQILATLSFLVIGAAVSSGQSYQIYIEQNQLLDKNSSPIGFGDTADGLTVNVFFGNVSSSFDYGFSSGTPILTPTLGDLSFMSSITWTAMIDGTPAGTDFMTPNAPGGFEAVSVGQKPVVAIMNAAGPGSLQVGSQVAFLEGAEFLSTGDNRTMSVGPIIGGLSALIGQSGSIQMVTVVPEPATYALMFGALGLGLVLWRRMRR